MEQVSGSLRPLSTSEISEIIQKFPELVPDFFKDEIFDKSDTNLLKDLFPFMEIEGVDLLKYVLPTVHFYSGENFERRPRINYLTAISGNKRYNMPNTFNQLLLDNRLEVTDKNILDLTKVFVLVAILGENYTIHYRRPCPSITFLEGKSIVDKKEILPIYRVHLKVKVNDEFQIYGFNIKNGQIQWATMNVEGKTTTKYYDFEIIK